jgi:hypothetical protein
MRLTAAALAVLVIATILLDPYTFALNASDMVIPAPWWQTAASLTGVPLLIAYLVLLRRQRTRPAFTLLVCEFLLVLAVAVVLVRRDGDSRFIRGFGAEEYLSWFLVALCVRVVLLALTHALVVQSQGSSGR